MNVLFDLSVRVRRHFVHGSGAFVSSSLAPRAASPRPGIFKDATSDETAGGDARGLEPHLPSSSRQRPANLLVGDVDGRRVERERAGATPPRVQKGANEKGGSKPPSTSTIVMPAKAGIQ